MPRDPRHDCLFEPIAIGPRTMKNRFYATPHATNFGSDLPGAEAYYRGTRAEGGWAAVSTGAAMITLEGDQPQWVLHHLVDDDDIRNLSLLTAKVHEHGALAGVELWLHPGGSGVRTRLPGSGSASLQRSRGLIESYTLSLSRSDIRDAQREYVRAAKRAVAAGFDLVTVHMRESAGVGYQFLTRSLNQRTDEYGGSLANRVRFSLELFEMLREEIDGEAALVAGFCVETLEGDFGTTLEDAVGLVQEVDPLVDLWDLQVGNWSDPDAGASRFHDQGWQVPHYQAIRPYAKKPMVGVGRFTDPDTMAQLVSAGTLDIIGAARPSISDPYLPAKIDDGRLDDIRECIGCNFCVSRVEFPGGLIACTQNATVGEEYRRGWHPERFSPAANAGSAVLVIGAGPAGLECAMVLGKRDMNNVHLVEASDDIGGSMRWIATVDGLHQWTRFVDYRRTQLGKLDNVTVITGRRLTSADALDYGAHIIVVATGAEWDRSGLSFATRRPVDFAPGAEQRVLVPEDIYRDGTDLPDGPYVVFDADSYYMGKSIAERLAKAGQPVTLVTPLLDAEGYMHYSGEGQRQLQRLREYGVTVVRQSVVARVTEDGVVVGSLIDGSTTNIPCVRVVMVTSRIPRSALYEELDADREALRGAGIAQLHRIGDCLVPRVTADVVFDGHRLAREIDSPNPSRPLPMIRERRVIGRIDSEFDAVIAGNPVEPVSSTFQTTRRPASVIGQLPGRSR